jgi:hypothetical protein
MAAVQIKTRFKLREKQKMGVRIEARWENVSGWIGEKRKTNSTAHLLSGPGVNTVKTMAIPTTIRRAIQRGSKSPMVLNINAAEGGLNPT